MCGELERAVVCRIIKGCDEHVFDAFEHDTDKIDYDSFDVAFLQRWGEYPVRMRSKCNRCSEVMRARLLRACNESLTLHRRRVKINRTMYFRPPPFRVVIHSLSDLLG